MYKSPPELFTFLIGKDTIIYKKIKSNLGSFLNGAVFLIFGREAVIRINSI
jgi:ribosomal protein L35AE/L33A